MWREVYLHCEEQGKDLCVIMGCSSKQQAQIVASLGEKSEKVACVRD